MARLVEQREKMADAGGQLLTAAAETDEKGQKSLKINLPSEEALAQFAEALAKLIAFRKHD